MAAVTTCQELALEHTENLRFSSAWDNAETTGKNISKKKNIVSMSTSSHHTLEANIIFLGAFFVVFAALFNIKASLLIAVGFLIGLGLMRMRG